MNTFPPQRQATEEELDAGMDDNMLCQAKGCNAILGEEWFACMSSYCQEHLCQDQYFSNEPFCRS